MDAALHRRLRSCTPPIHENSQGVTWPRTMYRHDRGGQRDVRLTMCRWAVVQLMGRYLR